MSTEINKDNVVLDFPNMSLIPSYIEALQEKFYRGIQPIKTQAEISEIEQNPEIYLETLNEQGGSITLANGKIIPKVPYETLWMQEDDIFIGEVSFRHELNDSLELYGGHIGYGIRPSLQGQGLGTLSLILIRQRAAKMKMEKLLVTCAPDNPASEKIILNNGGVYIDTQENPFGFGPTKRYWVTTQ